MNHLTDETLNEYLDNELTNRDEVDLHLSQCTDCAARLTALRALFDEIESLPELTLSRSLAAPFTRRDAGFILPNWLKLTATLQVVVALVVIGIVAPLVTQWLASYSQTYSIPPLNNLWVGLQMSFTTWMRSLQFVSLPDFSLHVFTLPTELTSETLLIVMIGMFLVWALGNWWLLHEKNNSLA